MKTIKTIKAIRSNSLTIDLGQQFTGTLKAWMKKDKDSQDYREFEILDNRYLYLNGNMTNDFYDTEDNLIESVVGKWYFDVELIEDPLKPDESKTIYQGTIIFLPNITGSRGVESIPPA